MTYIKAESGKYFNRDFLINAFVAESDYSIGTYHVYARFMDISGDVLIASFRKREDAENFLHHMLDIKWLAATNSVIEQ